MNEHSKPQPATVGTSPVPSIDLLAGNPRVPITVWRTARSDQDASRRIPARLASRMIAAHSYPGEAVIDLTEGHALTEVAVAGGRLYHKAGLSDEATPTAVIAAETGTGPSRSSERSRYAPRLTTAWPWPASRSSRTPRYERPYRCRADLPTRWKGRPPSTADCTARAENLAGAGAGAGAGRAHHRLTWLPRNDSAGGC